MEVDWFTVIAQILNFLVLVWLLKRFLYKPVLNAIDEREKKIASELEDAALHKAEARKEKEKFIQKKKTKKNEKKKKKKKKKKERKKKKYIKKIKLLTMNSILKWKRFVKKSNRKNNDYLKKHVWNLKFYKRN